MINIIDKHNCCGCNACKQACPKQCINTVQDIEGFLYPVVNKNLCIDCGLCEKVCPCINQNEKKLPKEVYASYTENEDIRLRSSSGGVFFTIAEYIINLSGIVFGARYNENWEVIHDYTKTLEGLYKFQGSKYVQSYIGETYINVRNFLRQDRYVLFSGTPCQIAGLKNFLRKDYDKLLTIEIACHGVPSPKVWKSYLDYINPNRLRITDINLRNKSRGWKKYTYLIKAKDKVLLDDFAYTSYYSKGFALNLSLRPSCYKCPSKNFKSGADITLADCWGIERINEILDDDKGLSTIIVNSEKAKRIIDDIKIKKYKIDYSLILQYNKSLKDSSIEPYYRKFFWKQFLKKGIIAIEDINSKLKNPFYRLFNRIITILTK